MNILIVDDETPAREELLWLLEQSGEPVCVLGQAEDAKTASKLLALHQERDEPVELIFLDVDMPGVGGMRLAELLQQQPADQRPMIVFVTAYQDYALDAFSVDAVDYLLKPVRLGRLKQALQKARERRRPTAASVASATRFLERISVEERGVYRVIPVDEILYFESEDGIVVVQTRQHRHITDFSLKFLEQNLDPKVFFRSHRSYIVSLDAIVSIAPWGAGTYRLILDREQDIGVPLARARASELKALIPWSAAVFEES